MINTTFNVDARNALKKGVDILANAVKVTLGPIKTSSFSTTPSQIWTPLFMVTLFPMTTSFSTNTLKLILQFFPIFAFFKITQYCQMDVPSPISVVCMSEVG